jgi:hypothetical protein
MAEQRTFIDLFHDPSPALNVKFNSASDEEPIKILVKNSIGSSSGWFGKRYLRSISKGPGLNEFFEFYSSHNGVELCKPVYPDNCLKTPLLTLIPAQYISAFTKQYVKNGEWAWIIDHNKSKSIYRGNDTWIAFARVGKGPSCLTIFLDGENAGSIYLAAPQPAFNILKPIAKTFNIFLERMAKDPAAFLRLLRSYISIKDIDGQNYGYVPVEYLSNSNMEEK